MRRISRRKAHVIRAWAVLLIFIRAFADAFKTGKQQWFRPFFCPLRKALLKGKPMNEEPHIGKLIKAALVEQGRTITWLAKQLGYSRQNAYKILNRKWIYTDLLLKICDILDYDFFKCFSEWREQRNEISTK